MNFRSVKTKTLVFILPLVLLTLVTIVIVSFILERNIVNKETERNMNEQLNKTASQIQVKLTAHEKLAEILAASAGYQYNDISRPGYFRLLTEILKTNEDSFGIGMAFEPYFYEKEEKYYATYAYKDGQTIVTTEDYSDPEYDYFNQEYYQIAATSQKLGYTTPYYDDGTQTAMVTTIVPVFDPKGRFVAVSNADIDLTTIQRTVSDIRVGEQGWAFLIDRNGTYLAGPEEDKIMKVKLQEDVDANTAKMGAALLREKSGEVAYKSPKGQTHVHFTSMPNTDWILAIAVPDSELSKPLNDLILKLTLIGAVGVLFIVALILLYTRNITGHIQKVNRVSQGLSIGDLTQTIPVTTKDEFGQMAGNLNQTIHQLREVISNVVSHTHTLASSSEQVSASMQQARSTATIVSETSRDTAKGAESQLTSAEESARAMEELATGIQRIAESASSILEVTQQTSDRAFAGNGMIQSAVKEITQSNENVQNIALQIEQLAASSNRIGTITSFISQISSQTNILALNASIEASRVGAQGKGFSVIAAEIRKLSEQINDSSKQINELIEQIQSFTNQVVDSVEEGSRSVMSSSERVREAGQEFGAIQSELQTIVAQFQEVSAVSEQISASSEEVTATVEDLSQVAEAARNNALQAASSSQEQLQSIENISSAIVSLDELTRELKRLVSNFKT